MSSLFRQGKESTARPYQIILFVLIPICVGVLAYNVFHGFSPPDSHELLAANYYDWSSGGSYFFQLNDTLFECKTLDSSIIAEIEDSPEKQPELVTVIWRDEAIDDNGFHSVTGEVYLESQMESTDALHEKESLQYYLIWGQANWGRCVLIPNKPQLFPLFALSRPLAFYLVQSDH